MCAEEDLYLNQSEEQGLYFSDTLHGNTDALDFGSFGDAYGLDDVSLNNILKPSLTSFETRDIFKPTGLNGDSFVDEVEAKCKICNSSSQQQGLTGNYVSYCNDNLHSSYGFTKPTVDLESISMAHNVPGHYTQGSRLTESGPSVIPAGSMVPSTGASEKLNGLTLEEIEPCCCHASLDAKTTASLGFSPEMVYTSATAVSVSTDTKPFVSLPQMLHNLHVAEAAWSQAYMGALEKLNGLTLEQIAPSCCHAFVDPKTTASLGFSPEMVYMPGRAISTNTDTKPFMLSPPMLPAAQAPWSQVAQAKGITLSGCGSQEMLMAAAAESSGMSSLNDNNTSPLTPSSRDGKEPVEGLAASENLMKISHKKHCYEALLRQESQTPHGMQGGMGANPSPTCDDGSHKVGKYTMEERRIRVQRYREKRTKRNFSKQIKYVCRKELAERRSRVQGRFAKTMGDELPIVVNGRKCEDGNNKESACGE